MRKNALIRWILFCLVIGGLIGCPEKKPEPPKEERGNAPDFTLPRLQGGEFTLSSLEGKVIILNFWASWCGPCRREVSELISLYKEYKPQGLEIVGISLDRDREAVESFAQKEGINYTIVLGNQDVVAKYGGIQGIPTTFIIDRNRNIVKKYEGFHSKAVFENEIKKLLGGKQ